MRDLESTFRQIGNPRVLVLGDIILDQYVRGTVDRISPEAPVMVFSAGQQECRLGGASSVANLLRGLGAHVELFGVVGDDSAGRHARKIMADTEIESAGVVTDSDRCTTAKLRYLGQAGDRHTQQLLRVDHEVHEPVAAELERRLLGDICRRLRDCKAVLIADYAKGVCTPELLRRVIHGAIECGIPVLVDPARGANWQMYSEASLLKPNRREAELACGRLIAGPEDALVIAESLCSSHGLGASVITLDADGMAAYEPGQCREVLPARRRTIYDITGAGDTALAMLGLCHAHGLPLRSSVELANIAAGIQVERVGVASISRDEILDAIRLHSSSSHKILAREDLLRLCSELRANGKRIVFTNGCYDLFHVGHLTSLEQAARHGDALVVGINGDASIRRLKGPGRPHIPAEQRARIVAALQCVRFVTVFEDDTPVDLLGHLQPDVLVKGGGYQPQEVVGWEIVAGYGGRIALTDHISGISTTSIAASVAAHVD